MAVQRETGERSRLMLDIEGFRAKKRDELRALAESTAEEVKRSGVAIALKPMNAFERKVIHDTIGELGLSSESEGEEPERHIVVLPA